MRRIVNIFLIAVMALAGTWACQKESPMLFSDVDRVNFKDSVTQSYTFIYENADVTRYDFYIEVVTIGDVVNYDRKVKLVQIPEYNVTYEYNDQGEVTNTIKTEIPNMAVPGKHYVSFDDASAQNEWVIKANRNSAKIPITLLRDASLKSETFRLRLTAARNDDFETGEVWLREKTVIFSDRLVRPAFWASVQNYNFGPWSAVKHQFMIDVSGERIDQEWYDTKVNGVQGALSHYQNFFKNELIKFNNDPANIASGKAPLKDENNVLVAFI